MLLARRRQGPRPAGANLLMLPKVSGNRVLNLLGRCHKRRKTQAPTPQAPIRNRQLRKVANAKGLNRNTNLT